MKKILITSIVTLSLSLSPLITNAGESQNQHPNGSNARRLGFFLLHSVCTIGGIYITKTNAYRALGSFTVRNANPAELEEIKDIARAELGQSYDRNTREMIVDGGIAILQKPSFLLKTSTFAVGGLTATIYGIQGLCRDLLSLFK